MRGALVPMDESSTSPAEAAAACASGQDGVVAQVPADPSTIAKLEMLYRSERHALVRFFTRYRTGADDARDLVQETFLRLSRIGGLGNAISRPEAYLRQIARNLLRDRARSASHQGAGLMADVEIETISDVDAVRHLEARDSLARVEAAMLRMKPKTREIFMAHRVHGLSYAQISAQTGLSVKGVEKQMSKAIAYLARALDRD